MIGPLAPGANRPAASALRVLIVADDPLTRAGLAALIAERSDHTVVAQLSGADVAGGPFTDADVILWDMGWASGTALDQLAALTSGEDLPAPVVALIQEGAEAPAAWTSGARGIFLRGTRIELVLAALPPIARGLIVLDPALSEALIARREPTGARSPAPPAISEPLTTREAEVLQYLAQGLANKVIARRMNIAESTVKFHINAILSKLGAQSRTDAVVRATRMGLIVL